MIPVFQYILAFTIGLIAVYYTIPVIVRISLAKNFGDEPNERKLNLKTIPNLGGIALFVGISIGTLIGMIKDSFPDWRYILSTMIIMFFIGFKDDVLVISARKKLMAQVLCAMILIILGNIRITNFHGILGVYEINYLWSISISVFTIVGIINAINLIDGIDGLAASISFISACSFGVLFYLTGQNNYVILCAATAGSLVSFFVYKVFGKTNKIFMGDTGSLILGLILSVCAIIFNETLLKERAVELKLSPIISLAILSIPIFDTIRIFAIRIITGKSPFSPDMNHIHHKFLRLGFTHLKTTLIIVAINFIIINLIFWFRAENANILLMLLLVTIALIMFLPEVWFDLRKPDEEAVNHGQSKSREVPTIPFEKKTLAGSNPYMHVEKIADEDNLKKVTV